MRSCWPALFLVLLGCPRKPVVVVEPPLALPEGVEEEQSRWADGPGAWREPGGLSLELPEGWAWREGPPAGALLLSARHASTGVEVQVWGFAWSGTAGPRARAGCEWMFSDTASHRRVPLLAPAVTATCLPDVPSQPTIQGWYGRHRAREIQVEVLYPAGRVVEGRLVVEALLLGLRDDGGR